MRTVALKATLAYPYAGRSLSPGDVFEASESDANLLKMIGRAVDADPASETAPKSKRTYRRRDLVPEP